MINATSTGYKNTSVVAIPDGTKLYASNKSKLLIAKKKPNSAKNPNCLPITRSDTLRATRNPPKMTTANA